MLRVPLNKAYLKRTIRPLYGWTQTTPNAGLLDPAWDRSVPIWPGMVVMKTTGQNMTLINATGVPYGLAALYVGGDGIDEVLDQGVNAFTAWVLGPDAEFEVLAPAFDASLSWTEPGDGTIGLVFARTANTATPDLVNGVGLRGQLVPAGTAGASARPVARLLEVESPSKIRIGGLTGTE